MPILLPNPWLLGIGFSVLTFTLIYGLKRILCTKLSKLFGKGGSKWDDIVVHTLEHTTILFMLSVSVYVAYRMVPHGPKHDLQVNRTFFVITMLQFAIWMNFLVNQWVNSFIKNQKEPSRC